MIAHCLDRGSFLLSHFGGQVKGPRPPVVCGRVVTLCGLGNQARCFRAVKVAAPAVATKVAAMSTSDLKPVLANSERFGE